MKGLLGFILVIFLIALTAGVIVRCESDESEPTVETVDSTLTAEV